MGWLGVHFTILLLLTLQFLPGNSVDHETIQRRKASSFTTATGTSSCFPGGWDTNPYCLTERWHSSSAVSPLIPSLRLAINLYWANFYLYYKLHRKITRLRFSLCLGPGRSKNSLGCAHCCAQTVSYPEGKHMESQTKRTQVFVTSCGQQQPFDGREIKNCWRLEWDFEGDLTAMSESWNLLCLNQMQLCWKASV